MKTNSKKKKVQGPFSKILSALMKEKNTTIAQAAKAAGVSSSTIADWKEGASPENYLAVQKLAEYFGVSLSFILTGKEEKTQALPTITQVFNEGDYLFDGFAKITIQRMIPKHKEQK